MSNPGFISAQRAGERPRDKLPTVQNLESTSNEQAISFQIKTCRGLRCLSSHPGVVHMPVSTIPVASGNGKMGQPVSKLPSSTKDVHGSGRTRLG